MTDTEARHFNYYLDDSIPVWLSIHKRWLEIPSSMGNNPSGSTNRKAVSKPLTLKMPDGEIIKFESRTEAANRLEIHLVSLAKKIRKSDGKSFVLDKVVYEIVSDGRGNDDE